MTRCIVPLVLLMAMPVMAAAGEARAGFVVSATVPPRVTLEVVALPATLTVSNQDIERGYVDVAAVYRVRNNDPAGFLVRLMPRVGLADAIEVSGLSVPVVVSDRTVSVTEAAAPRDRELTLQFRVMLDAGVPPGVYPVPLHVTVAAL